MTLLLLPLIAAFTPFFLYPIERILPFPYLIEEIALLLLILPLLKESTATQVKMTIAIGLLFTFSESVLYTFNMAAVGTPTTLIMRLLTTGALHTITPLLMLAGYHLYKKKGIIGGFFLAVTLHYIFNLLVTKLQ